MQDPSAVISSSAGSLKIILPFSIFVVRTSTSFSFWCTVYAGQAVRVGVEFGVGVGVEVVDDEALRALELNHVLRQSCERQAAASKRKDISAPQERRSRYRPAVFMYL